LWLAGKGIRPMKPKQPIGVAGKAGASPLSTGMKSGIRPIEAMLGATSGNQATTTPAVRLIPPSSATRCDPVVYVVCSLFPDSGRFSGRGTLP